jgi:hypothetical protein
MPNRESGCFLLIISVSDRLSQTVIITSATGTVTKLVTVTGSVPPPRKTTITTVVTEISTEAITETLFILPQPPPSLISDDFVADTSSSTCISFTFPTLSDSFPSSSTTVTDQILSSPTMVIDYFPSPPSTTAELVRRAAPKTRPSYIATSYPTSRILSACSCLLKAKVTVTRKGKIAVCHYIGNKPLV